MCLYEYLLTIFLMECHSVLDSLEGEESVFRWGTVLHVLVVLILLSTSRDKLFQKSLFPDKGLPAETLFFYLFLCIYA